MDISLKDTILIVPLAIGGFAWPVWEHFFPETCDVKAIALCLLAGFSISTIMTIVKLFRARKRPDGLMEDWKRQQRKIMAFEKANQYMGGLLASYEGTDNPQIKIIKKNFVQQMKIVREAAENEKH